jgi:predicted ATPase
MFSRGFGVEQAKSAFTRAKELSAGANNLDERFIAYYGLWIGAMARGELAQARENAESFWQEAESCGRATELAVGLRCLGLACLFRGELTEAQASLNRALSVYDPLRDQEVKFRFGADTGAAATAYLALVSWLLGEIPRARQLIEEAIARSAQANHVPTQINISHIASYIEILGRNTEAAQRLAEKVIRLAREHGLALYGMWGALIFGWARAHHGEREAGMSEMDSTLSALVEQGNKFFVPPFQGLLAELEVSAKGEEAALLRVNDAQALAVVTGEHWADSFLHRLRGDILLMGNPANAGAAEEEFRAAVEVARKQKSRSFELRAALSLAQLYQSTGRTADAHAVLEPALEGFLTAPEFPEVEEAQRLLAILCETDEVKRATASQQARLQLQNAYGQALVYAKGYTAPETSAALARARELAAGSANATERLSVDFGLWINQWMRGELAAASARATSLLREAIANQDLSARIVALRMCGACELYAGDFTAACQHFDELVRLYEPTLHRELAARFGISIGAYSLALWALGKIGETNAIVAEARAQAEPDTPAPALAIFYVSSLLGAALRRDRDEILANTSAMAEFVKLAEMQQYTGFAAFFEGVSRRLRGEQEGAWPRWSGRRSKFETKAF